MHADDELLALVLCLHMQVWPIPCSIGALIGNVTSLFICTVMYLCPGFKPSFRN